MVTCKSSCCVTAADWSLLIDRSFHKPAVSPAILYPWDHQSHEWLRSKSSRDILVNTLYNSPLFKGLLIPNSCPLLLYPWTRQWDTSTHTADAYGIHTISVNAALTHFVSLYLQNSSGFFFSIWLSFNFGSFTCTGFPGVVPSHFPS